jgi:hypothetical protein
LLRDGFVEKRAVDTCLYFDPRQRRAHAMQTVADSARPNCNLIIQAFFKETNGLSKPTPPGEKCGLARHNKRRMCSKWITISDLPRHRANVPR